MKKIVISVVSIVLVLAIVLSVTISNVNAASAEKMFASPDINAASLNFEKDYDGNSADPAKLTADNHAGDGYVKKAETADLELYVKVDKYHTALDSTTNQDRVDIAVYDKRSQKLWKSIMDDSQINFKLQPNYLTVMQSLISFTYYDYAKGDNKASAPTNSNDTKSTVKVQDIQNGVRISYEFPTLSISFALDFKLDKDRMDVVMPPDLIQEGINKADEIAQAKEKANALAAQLENDNNALDKADLSSLTEAQRKLVHSRVTSIAKNLLNIKNAITSGDKIDADLKNAISEMDKLKSTLKTADAASKILQDMEDCAAQLSDPNLNVGGHLDGLVSVQVLPYLGSGTHLTDGYVFYPDGSGAISYFNRYHSDLVTNLKQDIYTNSKNDVATYLGWTDSSDTDKHEQLTTMQMPVFGVKQGNSAFVSIIAEGDSDAGIQYQPTRPTVDAASISSYFIMRNTNMNTSSDGTSTDVIDKTLIDQNRRLRYVFLANDNADYSGMAVQYRDFMEKYGELNKSVYMDSEQPPLFLELFMGLKSTGNSVTQKYQKMTTYTQAKNMLSDLLNGGVSSINASLMGWSDAGNYNTYPDYRLNPESSLGGADGLKDLLSFADENSVRIGLEDQFTFGYADDMTFTDNDKGTTKNYGGFTIGYDSYHMFNPTVLFNKVMAANEKYKTFGSAVSTLSNEGRLIYVDYNSNAPYSRQQSMEVMKQIAVKTKETLGAVNYQYANIYMASAADWMMNMPTSDSQNLLADETVPFYQMVVHGTIPYTGLASNLMSDKTVQTLQSIEYGYMPFYLLSNDPQDARTSYTDFLFSSQYSQWKDDIEATYADYQKNVGDLWKVKMEKHEKLSDTLVKVTYENGACILINYGDSEQTVGSAVVPARSYKVVRS